MKTDTIASLRHQCIRPDDNVLTYDMLLFSLFANVLYNIHNSPTKSFLVSTGILQYMILYGVLLYTFIH